MKKLTLTFVSTLICVIFLNLCNPCKCFAQSKAFIPDTNFRSFLNTFYPAFMDGSGDSLLIDSAATLTGTLNCSSQSIADLTGVEYFINITALDCKFNNLTALPALDSLTSLLYLYCNDNQLTVLPGLTNNTALQRLECYINQLTALPDLANNTALAQLWCFWNQLTTLPDLSNNTALQQLYCYNNQLTTLPDLANNTALQRILCFNNRLTALPDLTNNTAMGEFYCENNKLDFSDARELRIADIITFYAYSPQNPFGTAGTFNFFTGDTLKLSIANQDSALSYQWFRGIDTIAGATDTLLIIPNVTLAESGVYTCRSYGTALLYPSPMTKGPGISSFVSEGFLVNISLVGISKLFDTDNWLRLYPNPNTGEFTLEMEIPEMQDGKGMAKSPLSSVPPLGGLKGGLDLGGLQINITNILGQSVYAQTLNNIQGKYKKQINLKPNPAGIYNLQIQYDKNMINKKIVLQK